MKIRMLLPLLLLLAQAGSGQFKNDNVLYKTVDPTDLCATLAKNKGYILLDVRTQAEFHDTSSSASYNLGHLKGAINIPVRELGSRLSEIVQYKNKPVFLYCSHSQRSRRAGKLLADSGYTNLFNINGGMTSLYYNVLPKNPCLQKLVETSNTYIYISAVELCNKMLQPKRPFILDVREDSAFRHISRDFKENAYGAFTGTVNIPLPVLADHLSELPKDNQIIITDIYGDMSAMAAVLLKKNGFKNVSVLIEGIDRMLLTDGKKLSCKNSFYQSPVRYKMITSEEFGRYTKTNKGFMLLDIRTADEFANKHTDSWRNIGHLQNAVNIPAAVLATTIEGLGNDKTKEIIIYSFGNSPELFEVADGLQKDGFSGIKILLGGIFNMRWASGNIKGQYYLKDMVVDVPVINQ
jgi:rhodanese-related sulfurtransferase